MNENAESGIMNALNWLACEEVDKKNQDRITELSGENIKLKLDAELKKWTILNQMYSMISQLIEEHSPAQGLRLCFRAESLVRLSYKLEYIDLTGFRSLLHYIEAKSLNFKIKADKENTRKES